MLPPKQQYMNNCILDSGDKSHPMYFIHETKDTVGFRLWFESLKCIAAAYASRPVPVSRHKAKEAYHKGQTPHEARSGCLIK